MPVKKKNVPGTKRETYENHVHRRAPLNEEKEERAWYKEKNTYDNHVHKLENRSCPACRRRASEQVKRN